MGLTPSHLRLPETSPTEARGGLDPAKAKRGDDSSCSTSGLVLATDKVIQTK